MSVPSRGEAGPGRWPVLGAVLAGGRGLRIGGQKAIVELRGRPLVSYPLDVLSRCCAEVVVVAKADTVLPNLPGVTVCVEPPEPRHPLCGIVEALAYAGGRAVIAVGADMPFVSEALLRRLAGTAPGGAPAVVPLHAGRWQPFPALYLPAAAPPLARAAAAGARVTDEIAALGVVPLPVADLQSFFSVNAPEDLLHAAAILDRQRGGAPARG